MKDRQDAFGHLILDYHNGVKCVEIIERDDSHIAHSSGPAFYFSKFDEWSEYSQKAMEYARGRVLDVGCGAGRHALYLQDKGFHAVGIDNSPLAIEVCRQRGVHNTAVMSITQVSSKLGEFDTILLMGANLGLLGSFKRAKWLLKRFKSMTSSEGRIIANTGDPYQTDLVEHLEYHEFNRRRGRMSGQVRIRVRYKKYMSPWFDYLRVSVDELREIVRDTGWQVTDILHGERGLYTAVIDKVCV